MVEQQATEFIEHLPFTTDRVVGARARIGVIVLATDYTLEHELRQLVTLPGVDVYHARIPNSPEIAPETLAAMGPLITQTAELILPGETFDVVAFACTSASMVLGTNVVEEKLRAAKPEASPTNPAAAAFAAFQALEARRIGVLSPYSKSVNEFVRASFAEAGFEVPVFGSFNEPHDPTAAAIDSRSLKSAVTRIANKGNVECIFVACTSIRVASAINEIEDELGIPVTSSNHALAWHCLRLSGIKEQLPEHGQLFCRS